MGSRKEEIIGAKYNKLTFLEEVEQRYTSTNRPIRRGIFLCECGNKKELDITSVKSGNTKSCGCLNANRKARKYYDSFFMEHPLYQTWVSFRKRCNNPKDKFFVKQGYDPVWDDYFEFFVWSIENGWKPDKFLTRKNKKKRYDPENAYYLTRQEIAQRSDKNPELIKKTCMERYGVENPSRSPEIIAKIQQTKLERYGNPHFTGNDKYGKEEEIKEFLGGLGYDFSSNWDLVENKEIDLYNDELKLGIEYCGAYWHNENSPTPRGRKYHYDKYKACKDRGVKLITIFSHEWRTRKRQIKRYLESCVGHYDHRFFARKCAVQQIDDQPEFVNKNHIQGYKRKSLASFGLFYGGELVGLMSMNFHHRKSKSIILDRLCFRGGTQVVGGASKLFAAAVKWSKDKCDVITTWSDNRWSSGDIYGRLGFELDEELKEDYLYVKGSQVKSKQSMTKKKMGCPPEIKEKDFALSLGYSRMWDCGKIRWIYRI